MKNEKIRNIAIIAHVDHGKTTLVDQMLKQGGSFREGSAVAERVMDSMDLERERGITIAAKNCAIHWKGVKINILDTPGHADFGGEVERALSMVDGAILLVDSAEGPLPQTRFVLQKSLQRGLPIIAVINKIDRKDSRPGEVLNHLYDLFIDLGANDKQIEFPVVFAIGRDGVAQPSLDEPRKDLAFLFDTIIESVPAPVAPEGEPFQMLVANLGYSDYVGRLAIGKVFSGTVRKNEQLLCMQKNDGVLPLRSVKLQVYEGISMAESEDVAFGEIAILAGAEEAEIGDTICTREQPRRMPRIDVDEPTISMLFLPNSSPFAGQDGKFLQGNRIGERLKREALTNVALRVEASPGDESFVVKGRGEFQMAILIEQMRRENFEMMVGRPQILFKEKDGKKLEPIEQLVVDCDEVSIGIVTEKLSRRKGKMTSMQPAGHGRMRLEFSIPSRGLIGYRNEFLTDTKGTGILSSYLAGYEEYRGDIVSRVNGSLVSDREGDAVPYALFNLDDRGIMFVTPGTRVYAGMIIGEHNRDNDLFVNPCRAKKLTNIRAAGKDENVVLTPPREMTLERAIEFIRDDELVEVTPKYVRLRKNVLPRSRGDD